MKKLPIILALALTLGAGQFAIASGDEADEKSEHRGGRDSDDLRVHKNAMPGDDVLVQKTPAAPAATEAFRAGTTLENLQAAFNGESNASAKYAAFAKTADEEGYGAVASLFRAASRAEQIHAENHADIIRSKGAEPKADVKPVEAKTTAENLKAAVAGETFERDAMYPAYMQVARADRDSNALRTFNYAQTAEAQHASYYTETGEKLVEYKDTKGVAWYVCPTCGATFRAADISTMTKCPVCFTRTRTFELVS